MKLMIVGQAPASSMSPGDPPLWNTSSLTRLASYAGVSPRDKLYDLAYFINLVEDYPGKQSSNHKYDAFPEDIAIARVQHVINVADTMNRTHVVLLGRAVSDAFCKVMKPTPLLTCDWFEWFVDDQGVSWVKSPHPSGVSTWWNDQVNLIKGTQFYHHLFAKASSDLHKTTFNRKAKK